jgi:hypothetical protein
MENGGGDIPVIGMAKPTSSPRITSPVAAKASNNGNYAYSVSAIRALRDLIRVAENMGAVSTDTMPALGRTDGLSLGLR